MTGIIDDYRDSYIRRMDEKASNAIFEAARDGMYPFNPGHIRFSHQSFSFHNTLVIEIEAFGWDIHIPQEEVLSRGFDGGLDYICEAVVSGCRYRPITPREDHILLGDN